MINPDLALRIVRESKVICYDAETDGLGYKANVVGHVISNFDDSIYTPVRHGGGGNIPNCDEWERALIDAFAERGRRGLLTVGHNLAFDCRVARNHGIVLPAPLEDTQINEALIDDVAPSYSLDGCSRRYGITPKLGDELYRRIAGLFGGVPDRKQMANYHRLAGDDPVAVDYATGDGITTLELWRAQQVKLDGFDLRRVHALECELIPYLAKMRAKGMRIDMDKANSIGAETDAAIEKALAPFPRGFNVNSPKEVEQLYRALGYTDFAKTATGKASFTESWLSTNEHGRQIIGVRQLRKAKDAFIKPLVDTHNYAGRVHAQLNQTKTDDYGAVGGRLSCSDPNLQAFPKRNKSVGKVVRQLVIPDEGMLIGEADFKQQEPRLYAHYSEDPKLLEGYSTIPNVDIHTIAQRYTGLDRDGAKRLGLGILACMGVRELAKRLGITERESKALQSSFLNEAFPSIRTFQKDAEATMRSRGHVLTLLGRRCHVLDHRLAYKGVSRVIQGSGGDHIKLSLLRANQYAETTNGELDILMTIHDSVMFQYTEGCDDAKDELVRIVEAVAQELELAVPIPVDVGVGRNWAEASYGK